MKIYYYGLLVAVFITLSVGGIILWRFARPIKDNIVWKSESATQLVYQQKYLLAHKGNCPSIKESDPLLLIENTAYAKETGLKPCLYCSPFYDEYKVVSIADGDSLKIQFYDEPRSVRLLNVDCPEMSSKASVTLQQAKLAKAFLANLLRGKNIIIEAEYRPNLPRNNFADKYNRLLNHVFVYDKEQRIHVNEALIRNGHSKYETRFGKSQRYHEQLRAAEILAKQEKLGLWK